MKRLWGDQFYHPKEKKWCSGTQKEGYVRGFTQYILDPIYKVWYYNYWEGGGEGSRGREGGWKGGCSGTRKEGYVRGFTHDILDPIYKVLYGLILKPFSSI